MKELDIHKTAPSDLAKLLERESQSSVMWQPDELASILRHQLAAPLVGDLQSLDPQLPEKLRRIVSDGGPRPESFGDLLRHPSPPLELLELAKQFFKIHGDEKQEALPSEIAAVLYLASISAALVRCYQRISSLTNESLAEKLSWAKSKPWIDESIHRLFDEALAHLAR